MKESNQEVLEKITNPHAFHSRRSAQWYYNENGSFQLAKTRART